MNTAATSAKETQQKQAMDIWVKMGVATPEVAAVLGIPAGAQTSDYGVDQANINQSNAAASASLTNAATKSESVVKEKPFTTAQKNQYRSEAYTAIKALSVPDAQKALEAKREEIEGYLGHAAYVSLYNDVLAAAGIKYNEDN
jgi:hypothetical protein